jgi:hypothetical protein
VRPLHSHARNGSVEPFSGDLSSPEGVGVSHVSDQVAGQRPAQERQKGNHPVCRTIQGSSCHCSCRTF